MNENASLIEFKMIDRWLQILIQNISIIKSVHDTIQYTQFYNSLSGEIDPNHQCASL